MNKKGVEKALAYLRYLPRVSEVNVKENKESLPKNKPRLGEHGGNCCGRGNRGSKAKGSFTRVGFEGGQFPFYLSRPSVDYYKHHYLRPQYPPLSLGQLQLMIDTGRIDPTQPIDLNTIQNTNVYSFDPIQNHSGVHLTDEGADTFTAKVNIEVQHAKEAVIATIERNGGVILNAYYDRWSLMALFNPQEFFEKGHIIPHRKLPPKSQVEFYTDPKSRGYLADPEKIAEERFALAQKYGYKLPDISSDPMYEMLTMRKDPRQVFFGLEPGWAVNLKDKVILRPTDEALQQFYKS